MAAAFKSNVKRPKVPKNNHEEDTELKSWLFPVSMEGRRSPAQAWQLSPPWGARNHHNDPDFRPCRWPWWRIF